MKARPRGALPITLSIAAMIAAIALANLGADSNPAKASADAASLPPPSNGAISPQDMADSLHFVIASDREAYCRIFVALQTGKAFSADPGAGGLSGESWRLPCEVLRSSAESIQSKGAEFSFALRSLHPIDPRDGPQTELEQTGLDFVANHPGQTFYGREILGGRRYVTAVYPDLPAVAACVDCHNQRLSPASPRHKTGDILGGVVVRVPLEF